jgi:diguanylate cyclase (GGDEF)-like protein
MPNEENQLNDGDKDGKSSAQPAFLRSELDAGGLLTVRHIICRGSKMPSDSCRTLRRNHGEAEPARLMATWQRLYYECVALLFVPSLYLRRFAGVGRAALAASLQRFASVTSRNSKGQVQSNVEEVKPFPAVERRRNATVHSQQREAGELAIFQELGKALTSSLQLDQVLRTIMEKIDEFLRPDNWSLLLLDEAKQELYFELAVGKASQALKDVRIKVGQGIAGWVAQHGEAVVVPDTSKDTRFFGKVDEKTKMETQSIVAVPVKFRDTCLGVIELINCFGPEGFNSRDLNLLEALADFAAIALENARHVKRIHELTITDDCTTLYNARHMGFILETEIYRSQRYNYEFSLVFIDLDHFKEVNDTHGHLIGSKLLAEIGSALKTHCRLIDFAFRYGGDEFVILLPQTSKENSLNVARRLHKMIRGTPWLEQAGLKVRITPSVGVASYPVDSKTKEGLLHLADEAMYLVKNTNRDSVAAANVGILPDTLANAESAS